MLFLLAYSPVYRGSRLASSYDFRVYDMVPGPFYVPIGFDGFLGAARMFQRLEKLHAFEKNLFHYTATEPEFR